MFRLLTSMTIALAWLAVAPHHAQAQPYEVWVVDQSDSPGKKHGGTLYIFAGTALSGDTASAVPTAKVDLGAETSALCRTRTGADPVRPHMVLFNRDPHARLAGLRRQRPRGAL